MPNLGASVFAPAQIVPVDKIVQQEIVTTTSAFTTTSIIPFDGSVPLSTEGAQILAINGFVPQSASNRIIIEGMWFGDHNSGGSLACALFEGTLNRAVGANARDTGGFVYSAPAFWEGSAGTTASRNYTMRGGSSAAGTTYINRNSAGSHYGLRLTAFLRVTEVKP